MVKIIISTVISTKLECTRHLGRIYAVPAGIVQGYGMLGLVLIVPILPLANTPAQVLLNKATLLSMLLSILASLLFTVLSVTLFKVIILKYTSASS